LVRIIPNYIAKEIFQQSLHLSIPESEARCNNCGNEACSEEEWITGTVETSFWRIFTAISFRLSYGPDCTIIE